MSEAIEHRVRISRRAKYVSLRMTVQRGLEIVIPHSFDARKIPEILERKRPWIAAVTERFAKIPKPEPAELRPAMIALPAISENWTATYTPSKRNSVKIQEARDNHLVLVGAIESELACRRALRRWLLEKAKRALPPWLEQMSAETNLPFVKVAVRLQRSRWGSCSRKKTISLNGKLLFLSPKIVRYLLIHELCHTAQMNHSQRFWDLVESKEPDYKELDKQISKSMPLVPRWINR